MVAKTDLAKFKNAWKNCPHIVSRGEQKNFAYFASEIGKRWEKDAKKVQRIDGGIICQKKVLALGAEKWKEAIEFGLANNLLSQAFVSGPGHFALL